MPGAEALRAELDHRLDAVEDYEGALDTARRWARERWFQAGVHILRNISTATEAGQAFTAIAEASIAGLLPERAALTGEIVIDGNDLANADEDAWCEVRGKDIGVVFQEPMTALNPVQWAGTMISKSKSTMWAIVSGIIGSTVSPER